MGFAAEMTKMTDGFLQSFNDRIGFLGQNIVDVAGLKEDTHRFLDRTRRDHRAMARRQKADLGAFVGGLVETVGDLRNAAQKAQHAVHQEVKSGHQAFQKGAKAMANKRHQFASLVKGVAHKSSKKHAA